MQQLEIIVSLLYINHNLKALFRNIKLMNWVLQDFRNIPLYDFIIKTPLQVEYTNSGTLLIEATKPLNNYTYILIYQSNEFYRNSLKKVIQLENENPSLFAASGTKQQIIYINYDGIYQAYSYWNQMLVTIKPQLQDNTQNISQNLSFQLQNKIPDWNINVLVYNSSIKLLNTNIVIKVNQTYLDYYPLIIEDVDIQKFEFLSYELYSGTVTNLYLSCEQCSKLITPIKTIQFINRKKLNIENIVNVQPYVNQSSLYVDSLNQKVYILDEQDDLLAEYETGYLNICSEISSAFNGEFIFTACKKQQQTFIHVAQCIKTQTLQCLQYGDNLLLENIQVVSKLVISGQYIFVGQQSNDIFLAIYKLINQENGMQLELVKIFKTSDFSLIDFTYQSFLLTTYKKNQQFKILVLGQSKYIFGIDAILQDDQLIFSEDFSVFNVELLLNNINNFFYQSYNFLQIEEVYTSIFDEQNQSLSVFVLIITNNNHYVIMLDFKETNEIQFLFILSQFSNYKQYRKVAVRNGYVATFYLKGLFSQLIVYKLPQVPMQEQKIFYGLGGEICYRAKYVIISSIIFNQNIVKIIDDFQETYNYNINSKYGIQINNSDGMLIEQEIKLTFSNDLNSETASIKLRKQELMEKVKI